MQTWEKLELGKFLLQTGWSEEQVQLAATQVISRAVYPASELRTSRWIKENSAICELTGYDESTQLLQHLADLPVDVPPE